MIEKFEIVGTGRYGFVDVVQGGQFVAQFVDGVYSGKSARAIAEAWIEAQNFVSSGTMQSILLEVQRDMLRLHDNGHIVDLRAVTYEACKLAGLHKSCVEEAQSHIEKVWGFECDGLNDEIECLYGTHN